MDELENCYTIENWICESHHRTEADYITFSKGWLEIGKMRKGCAGISNWCQASLSHHHYSLDIRELAMDHVTIRSCHSFSAWHHWARSRTIINWTVLIRWNSTKSKFATLPEITMWAREICYTSLRFPNIPVSLSHCVIRHVSASMLPIKARTWLAHARSRDRKKRDIGGQQEPNIPGSFSELVCTSCIS